MKDRRHLPRIGRQERQELPQHELHLGGARGKGSVTQTTGEEVCLHLSLHKEQSSSSEREEVQAPLGSYANTVLVQENTCQKPLEERLFLSSQSEGTVHHGGRGSWGTGMAAGA